MASVKLGLSGSEITLPTPQWIGGNTPSFPVTSNKQIEEKRMSDGSSRYGFYQDKYDWTLMWGFMSKTDLDIIKTLRAYNQTLHFQNNNEDSTWYNVIMVSFNYSPARPDIRQLGRYIVTITLKQE